MSDYFKDKGEEVLFLLKVVFDGQIKERCLEMVVGFGEELEKATEAIEYQVDYF